MLEPIKAIVRKASVSRSAPALFTLSTGRTGSTMLKEVLNLSPKVTAVHELRPYLWDLGKEIYDSDNLDDHKWIQRFLRGRWRPMARAKSEGKIFADTSPFLSHLAPALHNYFPNSKFIYLHRNPEKFVTSGMRRGWYKTHGFDRWRLTPKPGSEAYSVWGKWSRFQKICWLWAEHNSFCLECYSRLAPERRMILESAQLWRNPEASIKAVFGLLGIHEENLQPYVDLLQTPVNAQTDTGFDGPDKWPFELRRQLVDLAAPVAQKLGYSVDAENRFHTSSPSAAATRASVHLLPHRKPHDTL